MTKTMHAIAVAIAVAVTGACEQRAPTGEGRAPEPGEPAPTLHSAQEPSSTFRFQVDPGAPERERKPVTRAIATLRPTEGNAVTGTVVFEERPEGGLKVTSDVRGLAPGKHAHHIHVLGNCSSADAMSAGPHFHFHGSSLDKSVPIITGDLGDLTAGEARTATHETTLPDATLHGVFSILGRSVVVHEKPNDASKPPDGAAGPRLACGVIGVDDPDVRKQ